MAQSVTDAITAIKDTIYKSTKGLGRPEYINALEIIHGDVDAMIEAAKIEQSHEEEPSGT